MTYRKDRPAARGTAMALAGLTLAAASAAPAPAAAADPAEVLHYRLQATQPASPMNRAQALSVTEVWQAGDGSRVRALLERDLTRSPAEPGVAGHERVLTRTESRAYDPTEHRIVVHRLPTWLPAPAAYAIPAQIGDPRTLPDRVRDGDRRVTALREGTVRGVPVLRFRLGACRVAPDAQPGVMTILRPSVVSIRRDTHAPVRVEQPPCRKWRTRAPGLRFVDRRPGPSFDYLQFESLPATAATLAQLEMRPHPGAPEVDGVAIDAAEEAIKRPRPARPIVIRPRG